jgi:fumarate reductase subunit C
LCTKKATLRGKANFKGVFSSTIFAGIYQLNFSCGFAWFRMEQATNENSSLSRFFLNLALNLIFIVNLSMIMIHDLHYKTWFLIRSPNAQKCKIITTMTWWCKAPNKMALKLRRKPMLYFERIPETYESKFQMIT